MKEKGLLHDIEDQIHVERDMVKAKVTRSRVDSADNKPMMARIKEKVRSDEERSNELPISALGTKAARAPTFVQVVLPP